MPRELCLTCGQLDHNSTYLCPRTKKPRICFGHCKQYNIYKYSPYHNCTKRTYWTENPQYLLTFLLGKARGFQAFHDTLKEILEDKGIELEVLKYE